MSALIDNSNSVNIGKLVKRYPFDYLVGLIETAGTCWPLKRNIRALLNRLYYFQKGIDVYLKAIINRELPTLAQDFHMYIEGKHQEGLEEAENKKFQNPVRFSYIESYKYLLIEECFFSLVSMTSEAIIGEMAKYLNKNSGTDLNSSYTIIKILERLGWMQVYFTLHKNTYTNSMIKYLMAKLKPLLLALEEPAIFAVYGPIPKEAILSKILTGNIGHFYEQHAP